jgi:hypothetical protein
MRDRTQFIVIRRGIDDDCVQIKRLFHRIADTPYQVGLMIESCRVRYRLNLDGARFLESDADPVAMQTRCEFIDDSKCRRAEAALLHDSSHHIRHQGDTLETRVQDLQSLLPKLVNQPGAGPVQQPQRMLQFVVRGVRYIQYHGPVQHSRYLDRITHVGGLMASLHGLNDPAPLVDHPFGYLAPLLEHPLNNAATLLECLFCC